ncbi:hypothetical protein LINPERPRIM_LOCUS5837 [Linum perenne]
MQVGPVFVETDCRTVQQALGRQDQDNTEFGRIIEECRRLLACQPLCKVVFVRRECNRVADAIAKQSVHLTNPTVGGASPD